MYEIWIALIAVVVPVFTLVYTQFGLKHKAEADYVERMERRLAECERDRERLWKVVRELQSRAKRGAKRRRQMGAEE